jgi:hypothetical protein
MVIEAYVAVGRRRWIDSIEIMRTAPPVKAVAAHILHAGITDFLAVMAYASYLVIGEGGATRVTGLVGGDTEDIAIDPVYTLLAAIFISGINGLGLGTIGIIGRSTENNAVSGKDGFIQFPFARQAKDGEGK